MKLHPVLLSMTIVLAALLFFWGLGSIPLLTFNEARRAIPASNIFATGDWLLPRLNGELYLTKPPLLYWLAAGASHLIGAANEWAVRLPSAVAAAVIAAVTYRYARRQFGPWPALFAVQVLLANTGFAMDARRAHIEMLLTALCFCSLLSALKYTRDGGDRKWLWLSYFLLGAATLTKGPLALLFVTLPLLADALYQRQARPWQALRDPVGWAIFVVVGSSWFAAVTWQMGSGIWNAILQKDVVDKVSGSAGDPFYMYFLWLLADFLPWSLLLFAVPLSTWRRWRQQPSVVALAIAVAVPLLVYSCFGNKNAKYMLPVYPLVALLVGKRLGDLFEVAGAAVRRFILACTLLFPVGYAVFYAVAEARVFEYRYAAFPHFNAWLAEAGDVPLYGYVDLDERLIYYAKRDIPILDKAALQARRSTGAPLFLLAEGARAGDVETQSDCVVKQFKPYLKKDKTLTVLGFGSACAMGK
ncbi:MAG: glycosyltransferase family 39 protein [Propionivibrio sp.]